MNFVAYFFNSLLFCVDGGTMTLKDFYPAEFLWVETELFFSASLLRVRP